MKTDRIDAKKLAKALRAGQLKGIHVHEREDIAARSFVRLRKTIQKELLVYKARVKHKLHNNGISISEEVVQPVRLLVKRIHEMAQGRREAHVEFP